MSEEQYTRITIGSDRNVTYYSELEVSTYCKLEIQVIRQLHEAGVVRGVPVLDEESRYNDEDIALLRRARRLYQDLGVNLEGVEIILRLQARLEQMERELMAYRNKTQS